MTSEDPFYIKSTDSITVSVFPLYLDSQSNPEDNHYLWAYHVRIQNHGSEAVQVKGRHWEITDALGRLIVVDGTTVAGETPEILPGETFEYTSGTPLSTPSGIMVGFYKMAKSNGDIFQVGIPAFSLDSPHQPITLH